MFKKYFLILSIFIFTSQLNGDVIARLIKAEGDVTLKRMGTDSFSEKAKLGAAILNGDVKTILKIRENTKFGFMDTKNTRTVNLAYGTLLNNVKKQDRTKSFRIQTPVSVASVKGTEFAAIVSNAGVDQFICKEGLFEVLNMVSGETVSVAAGQKAVSNAMGSLIQAPASPGEYPEDPEVEEYQEPVEPEEIEEEVEPEEAPESQESPEQPEQEESPETEESPEEPETPEDSIEETEPETPEAPEKAESAPAKPFGMGMGIGSVTIDGVLYNQLALRPEINI
ncbi:MAG: FecR domain-containing protein, partial [Fidelibacterota bacterium]